MSRSIKARGQKFPRVKKRVLVGITARGSTFISSDMKCDEPLVVKRIFVVYNPERNSEVRSWLDTVKELLRYAE